MGKPTITKEGVRLLKRAVASILKRPNTFDMEDWLHHDASVKPKGATEEPYCGTVGCLAGHIALAAVKRAPKLGWDYYLTEELPEALRQHARGGSLDARTIAGVLLTGTTPPEFDRTEDTTPTSLLFYVDHWPPKFRTAYTARKTPLARARVLAKRVDHYLKTGE